MARHHRALAEYYLLDLRCVERSHITITHRHPRFWCFLRSFMHDDELGYTSERPCVCTHATWACSAVVLVCFTRRVMYHVSHVHATASQSRD